MTVFVSRMLTCLVLAGSLALLALPGTAQARTEVQFWHAMTGALAEALETQVKQFNESQSDFEVKPVRKGSYPETLTAAIAAYNMVARFLVALEVESERGVVTAAWKFWPCEPKAVNGVRPIQ